MPPRLKQGTPSAADLCEGSRRPFGGQVQRLVMMTSDGGGVDSYCRPRRTRTCFSSATTNNCSSTIDSHRQIPQRPKLSQSQASLQTSAQACFPQDPPSGGRPASVSDIFSSLSPRNSAPPKDLSNAGAGFTYLQPKQFASKTSLGDSLNVNADSA